MKKRSDIQVLSWGGYPYGKQKAVCFTFDDCNWTSHRIALILKIKGVRATFFLNTKLITTKFYYRWQYLVLKWLGFELGSHTRNHTVLTKVRPEVAESELRQSQDDLFRTYGRKPSVFSYPESQSNDITDAVVYKYYNAIRYNTMVERQQCYHIRTKTTAEEYDNLSDDFIQGSNSAMVIGGHGADGQGYEPISSRNLIRWVNRLKKRKDVIWFATFGELTMFEKVRNSVYVSLQGNQISFDIEKIRPLMQIYPDTPFLYCVVVQKGENRDIITVDLRNKTQFFI